MIAHQLDRHHQLLQTPSRRPGADGDALASSLCQEIPHNLQEARLGGRMYAFGCVHEMRNLPSTILTAGGWVTTGLSQAPQQAGGWEQVPLKAQLVPQDWRVDPFVGTPSCLAHGPSSCCREQLIGIPLRLETRAAANEQGCLTDALH